jgi:hypothetical protein
VSTLILIVVISTEEGRGELLFSEENELAKLDVEEDVLEWVDDKSVGDGEEDIDNVESEAAAEARATTTRVRTAEDHMIAYWWGSCEPVG